MPAMRADVRRPALGHAIAYAGIVFTVAVFVILVFWLVLPASFHIDEGSDYKSLYEPLARNLLAGRGYALADGQPIIGNTPGYPLLLAGIFGLSQLIGVPEEVTYTVFVLFCVGLAAIAIYQLARSVWSPRPALLGAFAWMTYPFVLWFTKQPNSEIPFMVVFYGGLALFCYAVLHKIYTWPVFFFTGLLIGVAMLIRPIAVGIGLLLVLVFWWIARELRPRYRLLLAVMLLLGNLVAVLPWEVWAYAKTGQLILLSTGGTPSMVDGLTFAVERKGYRLAIPVPADVAALMQDAQARDGELHSGGAIAALLLGDLRTRPVALLKLFVLKAVRSWYGTDSGRQETPILFIQTVYLVLLLLASGAAWRQRGAVRQLTVVVWLVVLYCWLMTIAVLPILRYMVPAMGLLFVLVPGLFPRAKRAMGVGLL